MSVIFLQLLYIGIICGSAAWLRSKVISCWTEGSIFYFWLCHKCFSSGELSHAIYEWLFMMYLFCPVLWLRRRLLLTTGRGLPIVSVFLLWSRLSLLYREMSSQTLVIVKVKPKKKKSNVIITGWSVMLITRDGILRCCTFSKNIAICMQEGRQCIWGQEMQWNKHYLLHLL